MGDEFVTVISLILESKGRIVFSGVGKSADVARKIVATLNSTGSPSFFVHAGDAVHGDLGGIQIGDVITNMAFQEVSNLEDYNSILAEFDSGANLAVRIVRNGNGSFITIKLEK